MVGAQQRRAGRGKADVSADEAVRPAEPLLLARVVATGSLDAVPDVGARAPNERFGPPEDEARERECLEVDQGGLCCDGLAPK